MSASSGVLRVGPYTFAGPWMLAPMAGATQMPFRVIARELGASAAPTELISAKGLVYGQARTAEYLRHDDKEHPFWVQLFGGEPESMAVGAERAKELGAAIIDVNMGCPVKKVVKGGAGSALMSDPRRAAAIVGAIIARTGLPVTAKIRSGRDASSINAIEVTRALADAGCALVTLHARTASQAYAGRADWSVIERLCAVSPIPIIGNGDIWSAVDGRRMIEQTGCRAVMVGRGALGNPWIFRALGDPAFSGPTAAERWQVIERHLRETLEFCGSVRSGVQAFRPHLLWYSHGMARAASFREHVVRIEALSELIEVAAEFFLSPGGRV